jgi:hypothetical protein
LQFDETTVVFYGFNDRCKKFLVSFFFLPDALFLEQVNTQQEGNLAEDV